MHELITSYFLQSKECILPGIGILQIVHTPASTDAVNHRILPPFDGIIFKKEDRSLSPALIQYVASKKHIDETEAEELLTSFCKEWKEKIEAGEKLNFETIGSIQKNGNGIIYFEKDKSYDFFKAVAINDPYSKTEVLIPSAEAPVLPAENEYKEEEKIVVERSYWGLWALILLAVGLVMLFYYFKDHRISHTTIGNQHKFIIDSARATYQLPK